MDGRLSGQAVARLQHEEAARSFIEFLVQSPTQFHAAAAVRRQLDAAGFSYLPENTSWSGAIEAGGAYYTVRNNSSVIAWRVGDDLESYHFQIAAAHGDSPTFKVKDLPELVDGDGYLRLDVEAYGGTIDYTWFDRPLTLAGRVLVRTGSCVSSRLVLLDEDLLVIPSLAIHFNRQINADGFAPNRVTEVCPVVSAGAVGAGAFTAKFAEELGVEPGQILAHDLFLVNRTRPTLWGADGELISAAKLDDLMCAYTALQGFLATRNPHCVTMYICFDNEEVGSGTKQGARSTFLPDVLARLNAALGRTQDDLLRAIASSMLVSCDNVHAVHPAHPELSDAVNRPHLNGGIVIKEAANQHYCTDAFSRAVFSGVLQRAGVPFQRFANRSDQAGGSTLGNLLNEQVSMHAIDVGCAQLAMHSCYETAGARDIGYAIQALAAFYAADIQISGADAALLC